MTERGPQAPDTNAIYVYAVCRAEAPLNLAGLIGVTRDEPVRALPIGSLTAIVQGVRSAEFTDEAWKERLTDEAELERYARAHHTVVSQVAAGTPTVPLPLATLYQGEDRARAALDNESPRFHRALSRIAHHAEWGVKVYAPKPSRDEEGSASAERPKDTVPTRPAPGAGRAYLDRKRNLQARREQRQGESLRVAEAVDADVSRIAKASRRLRPHGHGAAGDHRVQVLNATYLVADDRAGELDVLASSLRERTGAEIELSGPWVPYSFVGEV
ncbi:GvpL/GvpF family gas vesicle protein [Streptomyces sp. NPDC048211]|uniref:GvpL/GvpF family gas vesicle protein n=1 Tax=Streptomyces sp. NPDC048211 TaxID=3365516 RepID=UPI003712BDCC